MVFRRCGISSIFRSGSLKARFVILLVLAIALVVLDLKWAKMNQTRAYLSLAITPLQWLVDTPAQVADELSDVLITRTQLIEENRQLRQEALLLKRKVLQVSALTAENVRLRELLNGSQRLANDVTLTELIGINPDPFQHQVVLNKGSEDDVYVGQAVLDAGGIMGQIIELSHYTSRAMLITDSRHAIPVEVNRNGFRSIALGNGSVDELELGHVPDTADVREGDLLVSSGLGGRFPRGYPVARITSVKRDPGQTFATVKAKPTARLNKSRHILLVDLSEQQPEPLPLAGELVTEEADAAAQPES
ncbi:rod shape-determining protein MreC [Aliamphritea spongicola]|uniref:rod shape-determining protein MreC n=1 Tax=Aliamphritea spongicola TaxID=707589 RepID=UPI00196B7908|nr:rod shape-determining protein MreC [Aliamphritea spongicola]MBN3564488.1 rod shape-determining protein MreC [Aliamphritea spongicola]